MEKRVCVQGKTFCAISRRGSLSLSLSLPLRSLPDAPDGVREHVDRVVVLHA